MNISPKERFLDICHFKRPGDLCMLSTHNFFGGQTLEKWVEQGAPKEIIHPRFLNDYFQFEPMHWLSEIKSGIFWSMAYMGYAGGKEIPPKIDLGHGITVLPETLSPLVPAYESRFISEDKRTVTYTTGMGQTVKRLKESLKTEWGMPMFLDWPASFFMAFR